LNCYPLQTGMSRSHPCVKVGISTNARDESNILEWIAFHLAVGFDHVIVVDHLSKTPIQQLIEHSALQDRVTVVRCDNEERGVKLRIIKHICVPAMQKQGIEWMIHLDADEYVNLCGRHKYIQNFLSTFEKDVHQILVNWMLFGSGFHKTQPEGLVIENFTLCSGVADPHVKSFFRVNSFLDINNPHFVVLKPGLKSVTVFNQPLKKTYNAFQDHTDVHYSDFPCLINHYYCQSYQAYISRKINLPRDDDGDMRMQMSEHKVHFGNFTDLTPWNFSVPFLKMFPGAAKSTNNRSWPILKLQYSEKTREIMLCMKEKTVR
jgi:hypothetical protein